MSVVTSEQSSADLEDLGLQPGSIVLVHCSLSALGHVPGGEQTVVSALRRQVGDDGMIVVPTQSWQLCDPAYLDDPAVPVAMRAEVRKALPAYDRRLTPTRTMGKVADAVRTHPEALRSGHPHRSFAAWGPNAAEIVANHALDDPVGEGSPLAALYRLGASILLLGVGFSKCTALHLAESRSGIPTPRLNNGAPLLVDGERQWVEFTEPAVDDSDFDRIGETFAELEPDRAEHGTVGSAEAWLIDMRGLIDFAGDWMAHNRRRA